MISDNAKIGTGLLAGVSWSGIVATSVADCCDVNELIGIIDRFFRSLGTME